MPQSSLRQDDTHSSAHKRRKTDNSERQSLTEDATPSHDRDQSRERTQESEVLEALDPAEVEQWLDERDLDPEVTNIFDVTIFPVSATVMKRKRGTKALKHLVEQLHVGGKDHLVVGYRIKQEDIWEWLPRYKKFTLPNGETHQVGSCVFIKHDDSLDPIFDPDTHWKAQVLEVRGLDGAHVYLRVVWLEIPSELPGGAEKYHAPNELIPSNEMAILSASTVSGAFNIKYWDHTDDEAPLPDPDEYFWRQTLNKATGRLSKLRCICACKEPHNPTEQIINCNHCGAWLHAHCVLDRQATTTTPKGDEEDKSASNINGSGSKREAVATEESKLEMQEQSDIKDGRDSTTNDEKLTTKNTRSLPDKIRCLCCEEIIS
ncbi:hypothetical protein AAFC00_000163 [Neodothiora populina]|uniref:BAH domain-containing protein n=1 Tax=Neodothiora populina TaxID=2781224 RepID=A0ABR3P1M0_9PEZI